MKFDSELCRIITLFRIYWVILEAIINGKIKNCIAARINPFQILKHYSKDTHEGALVSKKLQVRKQLLLEIRRLRSQNQYSTFTDGKLRPKAIVTLYALFFIVNKLGIKIF